MCFTFGLFLFIRSTVLKLSSIIQRTSSCSRTKLQRRSVAGTRETRHENNYCRSDTTASSVTLSTRRPSRPSSPVRMTSGPGSGSSDADKSSKCYSVCEKLYQCVKEIKETSEKFHCCASNFADSKTLWVNKGKLLQPQKYGMLIFH